MSIERFHQLQGAHVFFKALHTADVPAIHSYASDREVSRFIGWRLMNNVEETLAFVEEMIRREAAGTHLYASIVLRETGEVIGTAMVFNFDKEANHAEIGYVFHKDHWGKGIGTEVVALMEEFCFEVLQLHKLHARVVSANKGSARVLEKNGFELEGRLQDFYFIEDAYFDSLLLGKLHKRA